MGDWTFVTKYALVLASIANNPDRTAREIGDDIGTTERTAHKIIIDLENDGYLTKMKVGVKNTYRIHPEKEKDRGPQRKTTDIAEIRL